MTTSPHDFDFILGRWTVTNRKLADVTDPDCDRWVEFEATSHASPVLGGVGHLDQMSVPAPTDGAPPFEALTLRLFDPEERVWRIWWSSSRVPGVLDTPMVGGFDGPDGVFEADDTVAGRPIRLRFDWSAGDPERPRWQQHFSYDGGATWALTWEMLFTRA
jgi:hypothetical protein